MSEEKFCVVCHQCVWFGAYGNSEDHVEYSSQSLVCCTCVETLKKLPVIKKEVDKRS